MYVLQENMQISFTWKFVNFFRFSFIYSDDEMYIKESGERISDMECCYTCVVYGIWKDVDGQPERRVFYTYNESRVITNS